MTTPGRRGHYAGAVSAHFMRARNPRRAAARPQRAPRPAAPVAPRARQRLAALPALPARAPAPVSAACRPDLADRVDAQSQGRDGGHRRRRQGAAAACVRRRGRRAGPRKRGARFFTPSALRPPPRPPPLQPRRPWARCRRCACRKNRCSGACERRRCFALPLRRESDAGIRTSYDAHGVVPRLLCANRPDHCFRCPARAGTRTRPRAAGAAFFRRCSSCSLPVRACPRTRADAASLAASRPRVRACAQRRPPPPLPLAAPRR